MDKDIGEEFVIQEIDHSLNVPFRLADLFTIPFFVLLGVFFLFIQSNLLDKHENFYYFFVVPMTLIVLLSLTVGRIWLRLRNVSNTKYFLTNKRIIFRDAKLDNVLKSFVFNEYGFEYSEKADGSGYIIISKKPKSISQFDFWAFRPVVGVPLFENSNIMYNINNVYKIYKLIKEQASGV